MRYTFYVLRSNNFFVLNVCCTQFRCSQTVSRCHVHSWLYELIHPLILDNLYLIVDVALCSKNCDAEFYRRLRMEHPEAKHFSSLEIHDYLTKNIFQFQHLVRTL